MKRVRLLIIVLLSGIILTACSPAERHASTASPSIPSTYAGVKIGKTAAKHLTKGRSAAKNALDTIDKYDTDKTTANKKRAYKSIDKMLKVFDDNVLADNEETFQWEVSEDQDDEDGAYLDSYSSTKEMRQAVAALAGDFATEAVSEKDGFKNNHAVVREFVKDLGLKLSPSWDQIIR